MLSWYHITVTNRAFSYHVTAAILVFPNDTFLSFGKWVLFWRKYFLLFGNTEHLWSRITYVTAKQVAKKHCIAYFTDCSIFSCVFAEIIRNFKRPPSLGEYQIFRGSRCRLASPYENNMAAVWGMCTISMNALKIGCSKQSVFFTLIVAEFNHALLSSQAKDTLFKLTSWFLLLFSLSAKL